MRRTIALAVAAIAAAGTLSVAAPATAVSAADVRVHQVGVLSDGGNTVTFRAVARCAPGLEVLEAFVTVSQDSFVQVFFPLSCDGRWQRFLLTGTVLPDEPQFTEGRAQASGFVLVEDPVSGDTVQAQHSRRMRLRGAAVPTTLSP